MVVTTVQSNLYMVAVVLLLRLIEQHKAKRDRRNGRVKTDLEVRLLLDLFLFSGKSIIGVHLEDPMRRVPLRAEAQAKCDRFYRQDYFSRSVPTCRFRKQPRLNAYLRWAADRKGNRVAVSAQCHRVSIRRTFGAYAQKSGKTAYRGNKRSLCVLIRCDWVEVQDSVVIDLQKRRPTLDRL